MPAVELLYQATLFGARPLLRMAAARRGKLARGLEGRRSAVARFEAWSAERRDPARPLVWLHAPSVGEGLMAQAIVAALRERRPELQFAFTHFSPSAERLAARVGADVYGYLPWDVRSETRRALGALRPVAIGFVRTEVWPVLTSEAGAAGARLALVNAVLAPGSSRLRPASRVLLGPAYRRLDRVGAVAADDAARFARLGVAASRVRITGDARFDQVMARVDALDRDGPLLRRLENPGGARRPDSHAAGLSYPHAEDSPRAYAGDSSHAHAGGSRNTLDRLHRARAATTVVAGSTWPPDEEQLVPAFVRARTTEGARLKLIVAPHEPHERHLSALERRLDAHGLAHARLGQVEHDASAAPEVLVIDRVGVLADSYAAADIAYVGGGFHAAGLHSVVEPAALAVPVLFGPRHGNAREAHELVDAGGAFEVSDAQDLARELVALARDDAGRQTAGAAAEAYVRSRLGGAARNAELVLELID